MELHNRLDVLLNLARELGIEIRSESLGGEGGGMCVLRGRRVLFVDTSADVETRYEKTVGAMAALAELDGRYVPPEVREDLDRMARGTGA
jgi:hypothetical protein